ncbi:GIY-YIG nuclease family protein [Candidatus Dependentiae bacterium]
MQPFFVYILRCADGSYYTGHTDNIEARIGTHKLGIIKQCYTYKLRPVELVYVEQFGTRCEALSAERQIKGWSRRKKMALINGEYELLKYLSKCKTK